MDEVSPPVLPEQRTVKHAIRVEATISHLLLGMLLPPEPRLPDTHLIGEDMCRATAIN